MTIGPWHVERAQRSNDMVGGAEPLYMIYAGGVKIAAVDDANDAAAIAALPEVVSALRDLVDAIPDATIAADPPLVAWIDRARAVLRSARG